MTLHNFVCDVCNVFTQDTNTKHIHKCFNCGGDMRWDVHVAIHGNYKHPVHSDAMAIHPDQRAEHEREFPNIRIDKQNRPIFDNFTDHEAYMKKCNIIKVRQKSKPKKQRIYSSKLPTPGV